MWYELSIVDSKYIESSKIFRGLHMNSSDVIGGPSEKAANSKIGVRYLLSVLFWDLGSFSLQIKSAFGLLCILLDSLKRILFGIKRIMISDNLNLWLSFYHSTVPFHSFKSYINLKANVCLRCHFFSFQVSTDFLCHCQSFRYSHKFNVITYWVQVEI